MELKATLDFLAELKDNNDRLWFEDNKPRYERARGAFLETVAALITEIGRFEDLGSVRPEACLFRIYRDARYARGKPPYKENMGALIGAEGRKTAFRGYYVHILPGGGSFLAGGLYNPSPVQLSALRDAIDADSRKLRKIVGAPDFVRLFGAISGDSLKTAPSGFSSGHPDIDLLRLKQFTALHSLSDAELLSPSFVAEAVEAFKAMRPFMLYLEKVTAGT
jgi:TIGR02453 family protein